MSREAVLLQWERKIEADERRPSRFERAEDEGVESGEGGTAERVPARTPPHEAPLRFERRAAELLTEQSVSERRTAPSPATRRPPAGARSPS